MKDEQDRELEALFRPQPIEDRGFSAGVMRRIERRLWLRRLALPVAAAVGGTVALRSIIDLQDLLGRLAGDLSTNAVAQRFAELSPQLGSGLMLIAVAFVALVCVPVLEE